MAPVRAAEPWREPPPHPRSTYVRRSQDPLTGQAEVGDAELSWGEGLVAPHANGLPPSEGGQYMPKCLPVELHGQSLTPRPNRTPPGQARGYAGERVAR